MARRFWRFADLALDRSAHEVVRGGRRIELTLTEYMPLELFLMHPHEVRAGLRSDADGRCPDR